MDKDYCQFPHSPDFAPTTLPERYVCGSRLIGSHKLELPLPTAAQQNEHIHLAGGIVELCASLGACYNEGDPLGHAFTTNPASVFEAGLEKELLNHVNLLAGVRLGLWAIEDAPGKKRPAPFPLLLKLVIYGSLTGSLSLREIYAEFRDRFPWCGNPHDNKWKNARGKRAAATGQDILPTDEDEDKMRSSFVGLVMTLILAYCPGSKEWDDRDALLAAAEGFMSFDRPLPPKKSNGRPLGVFDVNEGSKKGIIQMLKALQEISGLPEAEWAAKARIIIGDWLTSNNIRGARKDRMDDINPMERLDYVDELSALWHFALNATHMIMRLHFGDSVLDPGSLAKHKGLLNRTWDAEKPNYADAKALIRHSLTSRILYEVMLQKNIKRWTDLAKWRPTVDELTTFAQEFVEDFTIAVNADRAKNVNDDYYAHSLYFIRDALIFSTQSLLLMPEWKYELTPEAQAAKEQAWFFNRFGLRGRNIASDLYLEQNNFWVKRVNIAKGSGVTIKYITEKGSAPVEAFREVSHQFARTFGFADRARRHKEVDIGQDLRLLTETMMDAQLHVLTPNRPIYAPLKVNKKGVVASGPRVSAIVDSFDLGAQILNGGKFREFIRTTTWDPAAGYPSLTASTVIHLVEIASMIWMMETLTHSAIRALAP
ncbi:hypothetical protein B0H13DRAFT_2306538 [Mycena leptocephala]|nr:hypothetical protein B0H13DRAFT_2306538 [Mycena leptocephala]